MTSDSRFENAYLYDQAKQVGVIVAIDNIRHKLMMGKTTPPSLFYADVAFIEYNQLPNFELRNFKYIYRSSISNTKTQNRIDNVVKENPG